MTIHRIASRGSALIVVFTFSLSAFCLEIQGHRGARGARPENTWPAFEFALQNGVDTLELDIAVTRDRQLVISHDPEITAERCLNSDGKPLQAPVLIHDLTLKEVQSYDCGSIKNPRFPDQVLMPKTHIPTLDELFSQVEASSLPAARTVNFNIETKIFPSKPAITPPPEEFARMILEVVKKHHLVKRSTIESFDDRTLRAAKKIEPKIRTAMLTSDNHVDYAALAHATKFDILSPDADWILPEDVEKLHRMKIKVIPWTVNTAEGWDRLIAMKVDGIITDFPHLLIAHLKAKSLQSR